MFLPLWSLAINKLFGVFSFNTLSWIAFISSFLYRCGENDISGLMGWAGLHALLTTLMSCFINAGSYFAVIYRHDIDKSFIYFRKLWGILFFVAQKSVIVVVTETDLLKDVLYWALGEWLTTSDFCLVARLPWINYWNF